MNEAQEVQKNLEEVVRVDQGVIPVEISSAMPDSLRRHKTQHPDAWQRYGEPPGAGSQWVTWWGMKWDESGDFMIPVGIAMPEPVQQFVDFVRAKYNLPSSNVQVQGNYMPPGVGVIPHTDKNNNQELVGEIVAGSFGAGGIMVVDHRPASWSEGKFMAPLGADPRDYVTETCVRILLAHGDCCSMDAQDQEDVIHFILPVDADRYSVAVRCYN